ncbi:MAG: glycosyltransferase [Spirochaetaceae bacterium]|nr:MAG: glycosyltransferase [Spirochaetaceae bacterium]
MKEPSDRWWMVIPGPLERTTGGTIYDRRIVEGARTAGDEVTVVSLPGAFPAGLSKVDRAVCGRRLAALPDGAPVCVDGLVLPALQLELIDLARRCRLVTLIHHPTSEEPGLSEAMRAELWQAESAVMRSARRVVCTSAFTARVLGVRGVDVSRLAVVTPGVDPVAGDGRREARKEAEPDETGGSRDAAAATAGTSVGGCDSVRLLCVANLIERKGLAYLIQALDGLRDLDWQLTVVGSDELEPQTARALYHSARQRGLDQRVIFSGPRSSAALRQLYGQSDLFVLPSLYEGYGMVLTEAAAHALPIITTNGGAIPDTVADLGAVVVPAADADALAAALRRFLRDEEHRRNLGTRARAAVSRLQSWKTAAAGFARLMHNAAADAPERGSGAVAEIDSQTTESFDAGWLALRESADHAARDAALCTYLARTLRRTITPPRRPLRVLDLASGTGSNLRFLAPRLPLPQRWILCDIDAGLLDRGAKQCRDWIARRDLGGLIEIAAQVVDLSAGIPFPPGAEPPDLVTASALLDLVSRPWLKRLIEQLRSIDPFPALLAATVYHGVCRFEPADAADDAIINAFEKDMRRDKGFGPALGGRAVDEACRLLAGAGFSVRSHDSTWHLCASLRRAAGESECGALLERQLAFFAAAAERQGVDASNWLERRHAQLRGGTLDARIGHSDILALAARQRNLIP